MKLNIGAGNKIIPGYINHDLCQLKGIDVVHNLNVYPWPWATASIDEIIIHDVLEHLDDFMASMKEIHRILKKNGIVKIRVPYWNSWSTYADPTHKRGFHELTFQFFNSESELCKSRSYYSDVRFKVLTERFIIYLFSPYFSIPLLEKFIVGNKYLRYICSTINNSFLGFINDLEVILEKE